MIMARPRSFGRKQSIRRVMHPTKCIPTDSSRKLHMSSSPRRNQIYPTFESLVANVSSIRRKSSVSLRVDVMKDSFLVMHQTPKHCMYVMWSLMNGSQEEVIGYDNVGDEEIDEALKKISIGDIKPEEVHEGNDQGGGPSSSTPSTSMVPQVDEDQEKEDSQSQEKCANAN